MARYHINPTTGDSSICKAAVGKCPFGEYSPHFSSKASAETYFEDASSKNLIPKRFSQKAFNEYEKERKRIDGEFAKAQKLATENSKVRTATKKMIDTLREMGQPTEQLEKDQKARDAIAGKIYKDANSAFERFIVEHPGEETQYQQKKIADAARKRADDAERERAENARYSPSSCGGGGSSSTRC